MKLTADMVHKVIAEFDTLDADQVKFMEEASGPGGACWAMERYADQLFFSRQCARIVRPLLKAYEAITTPDAAVEWIDMVKDAKREYTDRLVRLHGRHNSTGIFHNAINQWEAEAMSRFVERLNYSQLDQ